VLNREFSPERAVPYFSDGARKAIFDFFKENGYIQIASTVVDLGEINEIDGSLMNRTVESVVKREQRAYAQLAIKGSLVGPVFLNGDYFKNGVAVWVPNTRATED
jgi:hypothetical protein